MPCKNVRFDFHLDNPLEVAFVVKGWDFLYCVNYNFCELSLFSIDSPPK